MKIKYLCFLFLFSFCGLYTLYSQEEKFKELVIDKYSKELQLTQDKVEKLTLIISDCNKKLLELNSDDVSSYNKVLKGEISKIYHLLDREQFQKFKKIRLNVEKNKIFRTK